MGQIHPAGSAKRSMDAADAAAIPGKQVAYINQVATEIGSGGHEWVYLRADVPMVTTPANAIPPTKWKVVATLWFPGAPPKSGDGTAFVIPSSVDAMIRSTTPPTDLSNPTRIVRLQKAGGTVDAWVGCQDWLGRLGLGGDPFKVTGDLPDGAAMTIAPAGVIFRPDPAIDGQTGGGGGGDLGGGGGGTATLTVSDSRVIAAQPGGMVWDSGINGDPKRDGNAMIDALVHLADMPTAPLRSDHDSYTPSAWGISRSNRGTNATSGPRLRIYTSISEAKTELASMFTGSSGAYGSNSVGLLAGESGQVVYHRVETPVILDPNWPGGGTGRSQYNTQGNLIDLSVNPPDEYLVVMGILPLAAWYSGAKWTSFSWTDLHWADNAPYYQQPVGLDWGYWLPPGAPGWREADWNQGGLWKPDGTPYASIRLSYAEYRDGTPVLPGWIEDFNHSPSGTYRQIIKWAGGFDPQANPDAMHYVAMRMKFDNRKPVSDGGSGVAFFDAFLRIGIGGTTAKFVELRNIKLGALGSFFLYPKSGGYAYASSFPAFDSLTKGHVVIKNPGTLTADDGINFLGAL